MAIIKLPKTEWQAFFDRASRILIGKNTEIEIIHPALGNQIEADWLPLLGMTYDLTSDTIEIALQGLYHVVTKPLALHVDETPASIITLQIIDADGVQEIILVRDPPMLPPPAPLY